VLKRKPRSISWLQIQPENYKILVARMKKAWGVFVVMLSVLCCLSAQSQPVSSKPAHFTLNGYVKDSLSGESIIGATITVNGQSKGVSSNQYGFYSLTLEEGEYIITASHVAYQLKPVAISLTRNQSFNFDLLSRASSNTEVVVYSRRRDANVKNAQMGKVDLTINQIKNVPAFMGEVDLLKVIQLLPGVRNAGEGNAGFYVRGGGPDQNLILLDDAVV